MVIIHYLLSFVDYFCIGGVVFIYFKEVVLLRVPYWWTFLAVILTVKWCFGGARVIFRINGCCSKSITLSSLGIYFALEELQSCFIQ